MTDADRLTEAGRLLYGDLWRGDLAADLGKDPRTLHRWVNGESPVPAAVWSLIRPRLLDRAHACHALAEALGESELHPQRRKRKPA